MILKARCYLKALLPYLNFHFQLGMFHTQLCVDGVFHSQRELSHKIDVPNSNIVIFVNLHLSGMCLGAALRTDTKRACA